MKKSLFGFGAVCCVSVVAMLAGCQKNGECCGTCQETAQVTKEGEVTPASAKAGTCCAEKSSCAEKASCSSKDKAAECPMGKQQN